MSQVGSFRWIDFIHIGCSQILLKLCELPNQEVCVGVLHVPCYVAVVSGVFLPWLSCMPFLHGFRAWLPCMAPGEPKDETDMECPDASSLDEALFMCSAMYSEDGGFPRARLPLCQITVRRECISTIQASCVSMKGCFLHTHKTICGYYHVSKVSSNNWVLHYLQQL